MSQSFCRNSRPSHPLPSLIVRCLRWLIRGCRRNQGSMPSSPKVLMGGKNLEKFFYAEKFLRNLHASSDSRASTRLRSLFIYSHVSSASFLLLLFLNLPKTISFHFSKHPRIIRRSKVSSTVLERSKLHRKTSKSGMGGGVFCYFSGFSSEIGRLAGPKSSGTRAAVVREPLHVLR